MDQPVVATVIEPVAELPLLVGVYQAGVVTLYEDRTMSVKWDDPEYAEEMYEGVLNGAPVALQVRAIG